MIDGKIVGKIEDIDKRDDLLLVTIDTDVMATKEHIKHFIETEADESLFKSWIEQQVFGFFIDRKGTDGYGQIYAFDGSVPDLTKPLYEVKLSKGMCLMETTLTPTQAENAGLCWACDNIPEYNCIKRRN